MGSVIRKNILIVAATLFVITGTTALYLTFKSENRTLKAVDSKAIKLLPAIKVPKLAIIIDDVGSYDELLALKDTGIQLTPAFFPPTKDFPYTPALAKMVEEFIIHLPLQADKHRTPQEDTIHTTHSKEEIRKKVREIKELFPEVAIVNNHTGSTFTKNREAMRRLLEVLSEEGIAFIDSRTTKETVGVIIGKELGIKVVERDVFLDNRADENYIRSQITLAVKEAKEKGRAVAIGHPRSMTLKVLKTSKDLFKDVELVYVKSLVNEAS